MLGTDFKGHPVTQVLCEELLPIAQEYYTSILLDRSTGDYLAMMTAEGGMDIEELARTRPEALRRVHVDAMLGMRAYPRARPHGVPALRGARGRRRRAQAHVRAAPGAGRHPGGDQPPRPAGGRARDRARREGHGRRQRAVPPRRHRGDEGGLPDRPGAGACEREGAPVREARGERGDHRQRRGPRDVHARPGGPGGREGRQLPGRGWWSERRPDGHVARGRALRSGGEGGVHQHLRRHHAMRSGCQGVLAALERVPATVPLVVRLDGTNAEDGRRILTEAAHPRIVPAATMWRPPSAPPRSRTGRRHERPGGHRDAPRRGRRHREGRHVPHAAQPGLRHPGRRGRHAGQGGAGCRRHPGVRHRRRRGARARRELLDDLRAAPLRRRGHPRGGRRRGGARRLHHRGDPGARHGARARAT